MSTLRLYHGSERLIEKPSLLAARPHNDYGPGFYCTTDVVLACEWATKFNRNGFMNAYILDNKGLKTLDLLDGTHNVLEWMALLLANRTFRLSAPVAIQARSYLIERYLPDLCGIDVVVGYRADDSYFSYAQAFVENTITVQTLERALFLGNLGEQTALVSERAFDALAFDAAEPVDCSIWYPHFASRDRRARQMWAQDVRFQHVEGTFVMDLIRGTEAGDVAPLRRAVLGRR